jgi:hypothetical protein
MNNFFWIILIILVNSCSYNIDYPDKSTIKKVLDPILKEECGSKIVTDTAKKINYFKGHFTNNEIDECLVVLSSINVWGYINVRPILLFENSIIGWKFSNWIILDADSALVSDVNGDNINEIFLRFTSFGSGRTFIDQKLISIKNKKEKIICKIEGFDDSNRKENLNEWKETDTISNIYEVTIIDNDNDEKKEIVEKRRIGFKDKIIKDSLVQKFTEITQIRHIK